MIPTKAVYKLFIASAMGIFILGLSSCNSAAEKAAASGAIAQQLFEAGDYDSAQRQVAAAISQRDDIPELYILQGRIEIAQGNKSNAFQAYSKALSLDSANPEALQAVAQLGLQTGAFREAERAADNILTLSPNQVDALQVKGLLAFVRNKHEEAIDYADRILAQQANNEGGVILKARTLAVSGKLDEALSLLQEQVATQGYTLGINLTLLEIYRTKQDLPNMLATFERIFGEDSADFGQGVAQFVIDYANTLYKSGDARAARLVLSPIIRGDAGYSEIFTRIPNIWREYDVNPLTESDVQYLSEKGAVEARIPIARYMLAAGRPEIAERILQSIATGQWPEARALYARALLALGQTDEAVAIASDILREDKTSGDALLVRARMYIAQKDFVRAINDLQIVVRDSPQMADGYLALARAYIAKGDPSGAIRIYEQASQALPQNSAIFETYSAFLLDQKLNRQAIVATRGFARDTPALISAWILYAKTCQRAGSGSCAQEAREGERQARSIYAIDMPPGSPPTRGLFGRLK